MKLLSSPFGFRGEGYIGKIYRPYIQVLISSKNIDDFIPVEFLVDTGADYTLLPKSYADLFRIDVIRDCKLDNTRGIGGTERIYLCKSLVIIQIGSFKKIIPVGFLERSDIPPLLGRLDAIESIVLVMKNKTTILEK